MLELVVEEAEAWDEAKEEIVLYPRVVLHLEHSLVSCSKWESIFKKPFLTESRTESKEENLAYLNCMSLDGPIDPDVLKRINQSHWDKIHEYIKDPQTATIIRSTSKQARKKTITAEVIYYWMIAQNIPIEFETWPLARLLTLIEVVSIESNPKKKKMASRDVTKMYHDLNAKRLAETGGNG